MVTCLEPTEREAVTCLAVDRSPAEPMAELVHRLRGDLARRPASDPALAGGLREWLADGLAPLTNALAPEDPPLVVTRRMLAARGPCSLRPGGPADPGLVRAALIGTVFRQCLSAPAGADPMTEALAGLAADGHSRHILAGMAALETAERRELARELTEVADRVRRQWTPIPAAWLPRTRERLSVPIGGRLVLTAVADLVLGRPSPRASVCVVSLRTGSPRPVDRSVRHLLALLETVRSGAQPFRVASYYATTGKLEIEDVTEELLAASVTSLLERIDHLELGNEAA